MRLERHRPAVPLLLLAALAAYQREPSPAGAAGEQGARIEPRVLEAIGASGEATFWVLLHERANLAPAYQLTEP